MFCLHYFHYFIISLFSQVFTDLVFASFHYFPAFPKFSVCMICFRICSPLDVGAGGLVNAGCFNGLGSSWNGGSPFLMAMLWRTHVALITDAANSGRVLRPWMRPGKRLRQNRTVFVITSNVVW